MLLTSEPFPQPMISFKLYVSGWGICMWKYRCPQSPKDHVRSLDTGVTGDCELSDMVLRTELEASEREVHLLNH